MFSGLAFALAWGECLRLSGPNGAGKSSLLRALAGFLPPESGALHAARPFAFLGPRDGLSPGLTALENLALAPDCAGDGLAALESWGLSHLARHPARLLSSGQRKRLALARIANAGARLWLLDEPESALDSDGRQRLERSIAAHCAGGGAAIIAAHGDLALPAGPRVEL